MRSIAIIRRSVKARAYLQVLLLLLRRSGTDWQDVAILRKILPFSREAAVFDDILMQVGRIQLVDGAMVCIFNRERIFPKRFRFHYSSSAA